MLLKFLRNSINLSLSTTPCLHVQEKLEKKLRMFMKADEENKVRTRFRSAPSPWGSIKVQYRGLFVQAITPSFCSDSQHALHPQRCFDCAALGPSYVVLADGKGTFLNIFVCSPCSGIHRTAQHRVKSVTAAKFSEEEVERLVEKGGNKVAK